MKESGKRRQTDRQIDSWIDKKGNDRGEGSKEVGEGERDVKYSVDTEIT